MVINVKRESLCIVLQIEFHYCLRVVQMLQQKLPTLMSSGTITSSSQKLINLASLFPFARQKYLLRVLGKNLLVHKMLCIEKQSSNVSFVARIN